MKSKNIIRVLLVTALVLLVPLIGMLLSDDVNWSVMDFVVAGTLLTITGLLLETILLKFQSRRKKTAAIALLTLAFLWLWAELAVGIFTHWGS